jgi:aspartyl protease family protein
MSDGTDALRLLYLFILLIALLSAFSLRRVRAKQTLRMVLAWLLIFAAVFGIFALREDFKALGTRIWQAVTGAPQQETRNGELRVAMADDGHFYIDGEVNGVPTRFLVDSGASVTIINPAFARQANIRPSGEPAFAQTARGPVQMDTGTAATLRIGPIERRDFVLWIERQDTPYNIIGMNLLSSLSRWSVEGRTLVLRP